MLKQTSAPGRLLIQKKIGSTNYRVRARFSKTSKETMEDKILRIVQNDLYFRSESATMGLPQTGRLPERGSL